MNTFARKQSTAMIEPVIKNGSDWLRASLNASHKRGLSFARVAGEVNELIATETNRKTASAIAKRMAGDAVARDIAKKLLGDFTGDAPTVVTAQQVEAFAKGEDLNPECKEKLALSLHNGRALYDATVDQMRSPEVESKPLGRHPDPNRYPGVVDKKAVAQAHPRALRTEKSPLPEPVTVTTRPGWVGSHAPIAVKAPDHVSHEKFVRVTEKG